VNCRYSLGKVVLLAGYFSGMLGLAVDGLASQRASSTAVTTDNTIDAQNGGFPKRKSKNGVYVL